jgi:uracil-DNA glycosylase family 4
MQKPKDCQGCPLEERGLGFSRPEGSGKNGVLVIGESLGREEYLKGTPFVKYAQAGSALEKAFTLTGVERQDHKLWNIVACQPPNNKLEGTDYGEKAIEHCKRFFRRVLSDHIRLCTVNNRISHPVILALGNVPLKVLTEVSGDPKEKQSISNLRGYVLPAREYPGVWVIGSYHPSFIRRGNANLFPALMDDIEKAGMVANGEFDWWKGGKGYSDISYNTHPSLSDAESFATKVEDNVNLPLGMDIETPTGIQADEDEREDIEHSNITLFQFSLGKGQGIAIPFEPLFIPAIKKIVRCRNLKLGFNWWSFDAPRVEAEGIKVNGQVHDLMVMFSKYSPGLRKHLQAVASYAKFPFPWKHMYGSNLEFYGCADVDALHWIWEWLPEQMKELGVWECYERQVYNYKSILDRSARIGIPIDANAREFLHESLCKERGSLELQLESLIPVETRAISPKKNNKETGEISEGYKKPPKKLALLLIKYKELKQKLEAEGKTVISFAKFALKKGYVKRGDKWARLLPLKVSKEQLIRYIKWKREQLLKDA